MRYFFIVCCLFFFTISEGQNRSASSNMFFDCGQSAATNILRAKHPEVFAKQQSLEKGWVSQVTSRNLKANKQSSTTYSTVYLPVVVHIIHNNGPENISNAQVLAGIQHLNEAFSNTGYYTSSGANAKIQFCLAKQDPSGSATTGITRDVSEFTNMGNADGTFTDDLNVKNINRWNPYCYINIWLVNDIPGSVAGYAYLPAAHGQPFDGLVFEAGYMGASQASSVVMIHEMGHYLGLYHTFEGTCTNNNCLIDGDQVCDTPPDQLLHASCTPNANSCSTDADDHSANNPLTTDVPDLGEDFMDYSPLSCGKVFTPGQADRMHYFIDNVRSSLLACTSCNSPCLLPVSGHIITPAAAPVAIVTGTTVSFNATAQNAGAIAWNIDNLPSFANTLASSAIFNTAGSFWVKFKAISNTPLICYGAIDSIRIIVKLPVTANFSAQNSCVGNVVNFLNSATGSPISYSWNYGDPGSGIYNTSTMPEGQHNYYNAGTYTITQTVSNGITSDTKTKTITIFAAPVQPTAFATHPTCTQPKGAIQITSPFTDVLYSFNNGITYQSTTASGPLSPGAYQVKVKSITGCGISAATTVVINPQPSVYILPVIVSSYIVYNQNDVPNQLVAGGINLLWYTTATGGVGNPVAPTPSTATLGTTIYYVSQNQGCGETVRVPVTVEIVAPQGCWRQVAEGYHFTIALRTDGTLWSWGANDFGQLGDGTTIDKNMPVQIGNQNDWKAVIAGGQHSIALKNDGSLWGWGENGPGQIGNGTSTPYIATPVRIGTENNWREIAAGGQYTVGIKTDGTMWSWGYNLWGQLGNGTADEDFVHIIPAQVGTDNNWYKLAAGHGHNLAIKANGTLWAWGWNMLGQLGDATYDDALTPKQIGVDNDWMEICASPRHSMAIKANGSLWSWGSNEYGELGDGPIGTYNNRNFPIQVANELTWRNVGTTLGDAFSFAIKADNSLWGWGLNVIGELGDGSYTDKTIPVKIGNSNWKQVSSRWNSSAGIQTDGTLWAWGENDRGQLGDGTTINSNVPVKVECAIAPAIADFSFTPNCTGHAVNFVNHSTGPISTYTWDFGDPASGSSNSSNLPEPSHIYNAPGTFIVKLTVANGAASNIKMLTITINDNINTIVDHTICEGDSYLGHNISGVHIDHFPAASGCDSVRTLNLLVTETLHSVIYKTICQGTSFLGHSTTGSFPDHFTAASGCDSIRTLELTVIPNAASTVNKTICNGLSYLGYTTTGTYVDHFPSANGCDSIRTLNLIVAPPTPGINLGNDLQLCEKSTIVLHAGSGFTGYVWQDHSTDSTFTAYLPGKYYVTAKSSCGGIVSDTIIVTTAPSLPFNLGADITKCKNELITITAPPGFTNYTWSGYKMSSTTGQVIQTSADLETAFVVTAQQSAGCLVMDSIRIKITQPVHTIINKVICSGDSYEGHSVQGTFVDNFVLANKCDSIRTLNLTVNPKLTPTFAQIPPLCQDDAAPVLPVQSKEGYSGTWNKIVNTHFVGTTSYIFTTSGGQCAQSFTMNIVVHPKPVAIVQNSGNAQAGVPYQLSISGGINYLWKDGATYLDNPFIGNPKAIIYNNTNFTFDITDKNNCTIQGYILVKVYKGATYYLPNSFTPNGDGLNDIFRATSVGIASTEYFRIFNRWGVLIYSSNQPEKGWDGTYKNVQQNSGSYIWEIKGKTNEGKQVILKGFVLLIR